MYCPSSSQKPVYDLPFSNKNHQSQQINSRSRGRLAIVVCQHVLLWGSLFVMTSTTYVAIVGTNLPWPAFVLMISSGLASCGYVMFANVASHSAAMPAIGSRKTHRSFYQTAAVSSLRLGFTLWLVCSAITITFTLARHPSCAVSGNARKACIIQRSSIGASLLTLLVSGTLFVLVEKVEEPFRCHLFGTAKTLILLPFTLPHKHQRPMYSEMSFKCVSSTTLSSYTLVNSLNESTTALLPTRPEKTVGLGIYTAKSSFLAPRPSLSSIRTHTTMRSMPPASPLPPLPAYFPAQYRHGSAMHKAVHPPPAQAGARPKRTRSDHAVRIDPPSPSLSVLNLARHNMSAESLSSMYSRSTSGERHSLSPMQQSKYLALMVRSIAIGAEEVRL